MMRPRYYPITQSKPSYQKAENTVLIAFLLAVVAAVAWGLIYLYKGLRKSKKAFHPKLSASPIASEPEIFIKSPRTKNTSKDGVPPPLDLPPTSTSDKSKRGEVEKPSMPKNSIRTAEIVAKLDQVREIREKKEEERNALKLKLELARMNKPVVTEKPRLIVSPKKSEVVSISQIKNPRIVNPIAIINKSATYLLNFKFEEAAANNLTKLLAFLFNFHLYNLASKVLVKGNEGIVLRCLSLRTSIVHSAQQAHLDEANVLTTQAMMKTFLFQEVIQRVQSHVKGQLIPESFFPELFKIAGHTINTPTSYSIQNTPLYRAFDYQKQNLGDIISEHTYIDDRIFYRWMKYEVIPCMNALRAVMPIQRDEALDAFRMLLIIFGEYCNKARAIRIEAEAYNYPGNIHAEPQLMKKLINTCRKARNHLAHNLENLDNQIINNILDYAFNINREGASLNAIRSILSPPAQEFLPTTRPRGMSYPS